MSAAEIAKASSGSSAVVIASGLVNLGNTCYMNSVVQCFKRVNELREALRKFPSPAQGNQPDTDTMMTLAGRKLMEEFD